jgi:hypothetical protein
VVASGERADDSRDGDVERYERLRRCALSGEPDGHRLGLALLERRGLVAWSRAWQQTAPSAPPAATAAVAPSAGADELVGVLAAMALACLGGR